jgi:hypothetical protein
MSPRIWETTTMDKVRFLLPKDGQAAAWLKLKARSARASLDSPSPTRAEACDLTRALVSHWTHELPDDRLDSIADIWPRFPLPVCEACVGNDGIAYQKLMGRTGRLEPRRAVPSDPEIYEWCNQYRADLHEIAKAGDIGNRSVESPSLVPARSIPTPEQIAHVWRRVDEIKEGCNRVLGIPTEEERREAAERILEAARRT